MSAIKYSYAMSDDVVVKAIASIGNRSASIRKNMHHVAVSIMHNWAESGAANVARDRAQAMLDQCDPAFGQKIVNWFTVHAGFEFDAEEKSFSYTRTTTSPEQFQAAKAETMFELTKDADPKPMDLLKDLKRVLAKAKKHRADGDTEKVPAETVSALETLVTEAS